MTAPDAFTCSIIREVMDEPVVAADVHSYERAAIKQWLFAEQCWGENGPSGVTGRRSRENRADVATALGSLPWPECAVG